MSKPIDIPIRKINFFDCHICNDSCTLSDDPNDLYNTGRLIIYENQPTVMCYICYDRYLSFKKYGYPK